MARGQFNNSDVQTMTFSEWHAFGSSKEHLAVQRKLLREARTAHWLECRTRDQKAEGSSPGSTFKVNWLY